MRPRTSPRPLTLPQCLFICGVELLFEVNHFFLKVSTARTGTAQLEANGGHAHAATSWRAADRLRTQLRWMLRPAPDCCVPSWASWLHTPLRPLPRAQALLWVPPSNPLNTYRLTITFLIALPGFNVRVAARVV